ncbi:hypothetical protein AtEden1_Chr5g0120501 [Arabidopsis thaliana]
MALYGMRVESPKGVKNAEMGHKEIENSRFSCKTRNLSSLHGNKDLKDCSLHHWRCNNGFLYYRDNSLGRRLGSQENPKVKVSFIRNVFPGLGYELFAMKYPTEFYEAVGPRFGFKSFEKHERAQGIPSAVNFVTKKELFLSMGHDLIDFCKDVTDDT